MQRSGFFIKQDVKGKHSHKVWKKSMENANKQTVVDRATTR